MKNILKEKLNESLEKATPLSDKVIKYLKNPYYTSGKKMKYGDLFVSALVKSKTIDNTSTITMVIFHESEIEEVARKYDYIENRGDIIVIKKKDDEL